MPILPDANCSAVLHGYLPATELCAGYTNGGKDFCSVGTCTAVLQISSNRVNGNIGISYLFLNKAVTFVETILVRGHKICFTEKKEKNISELSSIRHLLWCFV